VNLDSDHALDYAKDNIARRVVFRGAIAAPNGLLGIQKTYLLNTYLNAQLAYNS
jgi:hypothetical protein